MTDFLPGMAPAMPHVADDGAAGDEWYTPAFILFWLGRIALDPCWSAASIVRATVTLDLRRGQDGLATCWRTAVAAFLNHEGATIHRHAGIVFVNPPFSNCSDWLAKCANEAERGAGIVVALVPATPGDGPWHSSVWGRASWVGFLRDRVQFVNPKGRWETKGRGHALLVYGRDAAQVDAFVQQVAERAAGHPQAPVWVRQVAF